MQFKQLKMLVKDLKSKVEIMTRCGAQTDN